MRAFIRANGITSVHSPAAKRVARDRTICSNSAHNYSFLYLLFSSNFILSYRIHLSPGSRRSSSSATRAAIQRAIANPTPTPVDGHSGTPAGAADLDTPPPLAQANLPPPPLAQAHVPYPSSHQPYPVPPHASPLSQSHVPSPHIAQQPFPQTPPIPNGGAHIYENGNGLPVNVSRGYGRNQPESPAEHSGPGSATPSADASPVIGGPGTSSIVSQSYPAPPPPYLYVQQHPGYYQQSPQHATAALHGPGSNSASYASPSPNSSGSNGHYPPPPQISTFYQQHHYPREAYINTAPPSSAPPQAETTPSYPSHPLPQRIRSMLVEDIPETLAEDGRTSTVRTSVRRISYPTEREGSGLPRQNIRA